MFRTLKLKQGSVLVFSLIVLSILLSAAVAIATVSVANRQSTFSTAKSNQSFQVADSGAELILQQIYKTLPAHASINTLAAALGGGATCAGGAITKSGVAGGDIKVSFYDKDDNLINCADTAWRSKVVAIKSEGTAGGTTRLVETAVAAGSDFGWVVVSSGAHTGGVRMEMSSNPEEAWLDWSDGADHSPTKVCVDSGFLYYTGGRGANSARSQIQGSLLAARDSSGSWFMSCYFWTKMADFDDSSNSQILCAK
jgi:hypothetical protein